MVKRLTRNKALSIHFEGAFFMQNSELENQLITL
jgi:hypothetical protein